MQYCKDLPAYYDEAMEAPNLASFDNKDKINQDT